jgi:cellulose synthase/poly-beta-1,6-N-acetylglucosamine synthase-like glycosyltransferase
VRPLEGRGNGSPDVSVVVTAHDAVTTIGDCLRALAAQRGVAPATVEIVLVDDRSTDGTAEAARSSGVEALHIVRLGAYEDRRLTARQVALHRGMLAARGDVVFVTDADAIAKPDWLATSLGRMRAEQADAIAGAVTFRPAGAWLADLQTTDAAFYLEWVRRLARAGAAPGVLFGNFGVRREVYHALGGFPAIGHALTEDLAFARALHRGGFALAFEPRPLVSVRAAPTWASLVERAQRTSAGGVSALSVSLGAWMLALVLLAVAAPFSRLALAAFLARYAAGVAMAGVALGRAGLGRLLPWALVYEPSAIGVGACVLPRVLAGRPIEWGGVRYTRAGGEAAQSPPLAVASGRQHAGRHGLRR